MIKSLKDSFDRGILYLTSSSTLRHYSTNFHHNPYTYILRGNFEFFSHPNLLFFNGEQVFINKPSSGQEVANIDKVFNELHLEKKLNEYQKCKQIIDLGSKEYCLISTEWSFNNFYHFMFDSFGKIAILQKAFDIKDLHFLIPEGSLFFKDFFDIFGIKYSYYVFNKIYKGNFLVPSMLTNTDHPTYDHYNFFNLLLKKSSINNDFKGKDSFIYISRKNKRAILNEEHLFNYLNSLAPFQKVYLEDMSIKEQLITISNAKFIAAPHGAGLSWTIFQKDGVLLEIHSPYWLNTCFEHLAKNNPNIKYHEFKCQATKSMETVHDNFEIDLVKFKLFFEANCQAQLIAMQDY